MEVLSILFYMTYLHENFIPDRNFFILTTIILERDKSPGLQLQMAGLFAGFSQNFTSTKFISDLRLGDIAKPLPRRVS